MWPGAMNSSLALSTSSSGSCASFTNEVKSPMLHSRKVARSICIDMEGNQDSSIPLSCSQCSREVWIIRDISTQGKQLDQQSKTTNRRKEEPAEPCSRESGGASKWPPPPRGRGSSRGAHPRCDGDSKNSFATGSHRKADSFHSSPRAELGSRLAQS